MEEHFITVRKTARYYTLGNGQAQELWIACHGYAQLARSFVRAFEPIDDGSRLIIAPEALNRYYHETSPGMHAPDARVGATWMTREDREHEVGDYIGYLDQLVREVSRGRERSVVALGFSQGAATVSRWAARGSTRIGHVILWGSPPAHDLGDGELAMRGARLMIAIGNEDASFPPDQAERLAAGLRIAGVDYELVRYAGGHHLAAAPLAEVAARVRRLPHGGVGR